MQGRIRSRLVGLVWVGVFDELLALRTLTLHNNDLTSLPADVFAELLLLEELTLYGNDLTALPATAGLFDAFSPFWGLPFDAPAAPRRAAGPGRCRILFDGRYDRMIISLGRGCESAP